LSVVPNCALSAKSKGRSAISNGSIVLRDVDGRTARMRRLRDLIEMHVDDLGGPTQVSEAERSICRRIGTLTVELETLEAKFEDQGEALPNQLDLYQRTAGNLRRLLESIGLQRRPRNVTPQTLAQYIDAKHAARGSE
jgi:hypothetical protein